MGGRDKPGHDELNIELRGSASLRENFPRAKTKNRCPVSGAVRLGAIPELERMYAATVTVARTK
jgi:hypothetical protein